MPYVIKPTRRILTALVVAAGAAGFATPAQAATAPSRCVTPAFSQIFLPWKDSALYTLSPGGSFESGAPGWSLGSTRLVAGNESFYVGGRTHRTSLSVPVGATAVSASMCIDRTYPSFRFFARNAGSVKSQLQVEVQWLESGVVKRFKAGLDKQAGTGWTPVKSLKLPSGALSTGRLEPVTFRFTAVGAGGAWQVDDLYVDPYMRR